MELLYFDVCCQGNVNQLQQVWEVSSAQLSYLLNKTTVNRLKKYTLLSPS